MTEIVGVSSAIPSRLDLKTACSLTKRFVTCDGIPSMDSILYWVITLNKISPASLRFLAERMNMFHKGFVLSMLFGC